jgi:hypothetical protein
MSKLPKKCVVDTNVPINANKALNIEINTDVPLECILACVDIIQQIQKESCIVIDTNGEILNEYRKNLLFKGQPGLGDSFLKWIHDNQGTPDKVCKVEINQDGYSYIEFPDHPDLRDFDPSDRKFVAVANTHPHKPPIFQATDSKWWEWKEALQEVGIEVIFLCPGYIESKFRKKMS